MLDIDLNKNAIALRPVRIVGDEFRFYEAVTFPENPWQGCELYLRRCGAFGHLVSTNDAYAVVDVLDVNSDIVQDFGVTRGGFNYLREKLKFRVSP